jgi:Dyp-type peroxidase family
MPSPASTPNSLTVIEPVLAMQDIQGIAVPGFLKPHQTLLGLVCRSESKSIRLFKQFLMDLTRQIATAEQTLADRRQHRKKTAERGRARGRRVQAVPLTAITFSYAGLRKLTPGAQEIPSVAFREGLASRSSLLGDPTDPKSEGNPKRWRVGGPEKTLDALLIVAGDTRPAVDQRTAKLLAQVRKAKLKVVYREKGDVRPDLPGHEHFGFDDGISQPGIRGRASAQPHDFITDRHIAPAEEPDHSLYGYPGQDLVWPGTLVLGYPATSPDPLIPGDVATPTPAWTANGSFLVFRRLRQDVGLFWRTVRAEAARLARLPGFADLTDEKLASRIVGRWPSGAPVNRVPEADLKRLGRDKNANNYFKFDSDAPPLARRSGKTDPYPPSKADPAGLICPWAAHIRKVNTRDSGSDMGGRDSTYIRRLLRVGVPFGKPLRNRYAHDQRERGLLFLSVQASIEDQFEFLVSRWMGDPTRPKMPGGHDILVGQNDTPSESRVRRCVIFGSSAEEAHLATDAEWIVPTGGGYFFIPSINALRTVIAVH